MDISEKIQYWIDAWESQIEKLEDPFHGINFLNSHLLLRNIIDELVFNKFQNIENKQYFLKAIEAFLASDPATKKLFSSEWAMIRREFGGERIQYLQQLCRSVESSYSRKAYLHELYSALRLVLASSTWQAGDDSTIKLLSLYMIVELSVIGFDLETIKSLPADLINNNFSGYFGKTLYNIDDELPTKDGVFNAAGYRAAMDAKKAGLTLEDRLNAFSMCFQPSGSEVFLIFQIEGLKGDSLDINIGNVNVYSPKSKKYVKTPGFAYSSNDKDVEFFGCSSDDCFANAAVRLFDFDNNASRKRAIFEIEKSLDLIRAFVQPTVPFRIKSEKLIRVSPTGEYRGEAEIWNERDDEEYKLLFSLDTTGVFENIFPEDFLKNAGKHLLNSKNIDSFGLRFARSLHWFRKAEETRSPEDKLLAYWIVIENLVEKEFHDSNLLLAKKERESKFLLIRELGSSLLCCGALNQSAFSLYRRLRSLLGTRTNGIPHLDLPELLLIESQLKLSSGETSPDLRKFINSLMNVANAIERKLLKEDVIDVWNLHSDAKFALTSVETLLTAVKADLLLIYRLRNRIVHNADYDNVQLPLWISKARIYAGTMIRQVVDDLFSERESTIEGSLLRYHIEIGLIREKLAKGEMVDFLQLAR